MKRSLMKMFTKSKDNSSDAKISLGYSRFQMLILRLKFLKQVDLTSTTPALALMYLDQSVYDLADGFKDSLVKSETENRKQIFLDYFKENERSVVDTLKKQCVKNIKFIESQYTEYTDSFKITTVNPAVDIILQELNSRSYTYFDLRDKLSLLHILSTDLFNTKLDQYDNNVDRKNSFTGASLTFEHLKNVLDKATVNYQVDNSKSDQVDKEWLQIQAMKHLVILNLFINPTYWCAEDANKEGWLQRNENANFNLFVSNVPSKTPEGMISIWDDTTYPTMFQDLYTSSIDQVDMHDYLGHLFGLLHS